ncbi:MAG: 2-dehydro-3-deoxygalactonokinase [Candidatus Azotimanducaceae bacterium]|jgi:2-dehydro-3-deoxygalactonokinase|tara:strand:+ start:4324 stop:5334 length:1011 start_codon:yes stop_codon:yes gene_type:complete
MMPLSKHTNNQSRQMEPEANVSPLIIVDWGTTNFRAYLVSRAAHEYGTCQAKVATSDGLQSVLGNYPEVLASHIGHWLKSAEPIPILLSGMVGSPNGWIEVPHIACPGNIQKLAQNAHRVRDFNKGNTWIIAGLSGHSISGHFDVMRGEEVQYFGAASIIKEQNLPTPEIICFPGTHNKWIDASANAEGQLEQFSTSMTGEVFSLLAKHSLLSNSISEHSSWQHKAFLEGLDNSASAGGIMHQLFTVRSLQLSGAHTNDAGEAYLSGLLIGSEIRSMLNTPNQSKDKNVAIVGANDLTMRYKSALEHLGHSAFTIDAEEATIAGALKIAQHLNPQA